VSSKIITSLHWFAAGTGASVPALGYFVALAPPLFSGISLMLTPLAAALIYIAYTSWPSSKPSVNRKMLRRAKWCLAGAVVAIIAYLGSLNALTVTDPTGDIRYQIGFRTVPWSLTTTGKGDVARHPGATPNELMDIEAAYRADGPAIIWTASSLFLAGVLLSGVYVAGIGLWTYAFALFATHHSKTQVAD